MKLLTMTNTDIGRTDGKTTYFVSLGRLPDSWKAQMLHHLDDWYGNTDQDVEVWATEYQLWARNLLMSDETFFMLNPQFLAIDEMKEELRRLLGSLYETYAFAKYLLQHNAYDDVEPGVIFHVKNDGTVMTSKNKYCVAVTRTGCICVMADTGAEAMDIANHQPTSAISWSDDWNATDFVEDSSILEQECVAEKAF